MKNVTLCNDGKYRWVYEMNLYKNFAVLFLLIRIFFYIILGMWLFASLICIKSEHGFFNAVKAQAPVMGILFGIFIVLSIIGYLIYAKIMGGKYCVLFEMDDEGVEHIQMENQVEKAELIGEIAVLAGIATGNPGLIGTGLIAGSRSSMYSMFSDVRNIKVSRVNHVIRINTLLTHNQVYADGEDFDFVLDYIREHTKK